MKESIEQIVTDEEINKAWGYANFGNVSKRSVIIEALKKYTQGYRSGKTADSILKELGLVNGQNYLTDKGLKYLLVDTTQDSKDGSIIAPIECYEKVSVEDETPPLNEDVICISINGHSSTYAIPSNEVWTSVMRQDQLEFWLKKTTLSSPAVCGMRWVTVVEDDEKTLPEYGTRVVAKFNDCDADLGWFMYHTDPECGEKSIYFRSINDDIGNTFIRGLKVEWLDESASPAVKDEPFDWKGCCNMCDDMAYCNSIKACLKSTT